MTRHQIRDPEKCNECRTEPTPARADGTYPKRCAACARIAADKAAEARAAAKARGKCIFPGCKAKANKGRTLCKPHLAYYAERTRAAKAETQ